MLSEVSWSVCEHNPDQKYKYESDPVLKKEKCTLG